MYVLQEQLSQNRMEEVRQQSKGDEDIEGCLRKELEQSREELKKLKSELLRKEYKHDTEMVCSFYIIDTFRTFLTQCVYMHMP